MPTPPEEQQDNLDGLVHNAFAQAEAAGLAQVQQDVNAWYNSIVGQAMPMQVKTGRSTVLVPCGNESHANAIVPVSGNQSKCLKCIRVFSVRNPRPKKNWLYGQEYVKMKPEPIPVPDMPDITAADEPDFDPDDQDE